jgi:hypothetical protein
LTEIQAGAFGCVHFDGCVSGDLYELPGV